MTHWNLVMRTGITHGIMENWKRRAKEWAIPCAFTLEWAACVRPRDVLLVARHQSRSLPSWSHGRATCGNDPESHGEATPTLLNQCNQHVATTLSPTRKPHQPTPPDGCAPKDTGFRSSRGMFGHQPKGLERLLGIQGFDNHNPSPVLRASPTAARR